MQKNISEIYTKKSNFWIRIAFFMFVIMLFVPINIFVKLPLSVVIFCLVTFVSITKLRAKYIMPVINEQLDTKLFKELIYSTNNNNKYALEEVLSAYLEGDYNTVVNICSLKLADKKCAIHKFSYLQYLGRVYFDLGEFEKLQEVCNDFESAISKKKNADGIRKSNKLFQYFKSYLEGNFEGCYELYRNLYEDPNYCKTKLIKVQIGHSYGVACYKTGRMDEAKSVFAYVAEIADKLNYGNMAKRYLNAISGNHQYKYEKTEIEIEKEFSVGAPHKPTVKKSHLIICLVSIAFLMIMATAVSIKGLPKAPKGAIASQTEIGEVIKTFALNEEGDSLCLYQNKTGAYCVAYLDCAEKDKYVCKITEKGISEKYQYTISAPDSDLSIYYSVYKNKEDMPDSAYAVFEYGQDGKAYFCIEEIEENDVIFYSRAMRLKEIYMEEFYN